MSDMTESPSIDSSEPKYDAFLSYSSTDRPVARRIQRFLESYRPPNRSRRLRVYLDETDMRGGSLPENLSKALSDSRALVVCWSDQAADSLWVKNEITEFRALGLESQIAVVHVAGSGPTVKHDVFTGLEPVEHDLRRGWCAGFLTPKGKLEVLRLIAFLTGADMRALRNWARRRTFRNALISLAVITLPVGGILSIPIPTWDPLSLSHYDKPIVPLACEVVNGKLWVAEWSEAAGEVSGTRAYFITYPDVLTDPKKVVPRSRGFALPKRALPVSMVRSDLKARVKKVLDVSGVSKNRQRDIARIVQSRPDRFVFIQPFINKPSRQDVEGSLIDRLPIFETLGSLVVVDEEGSPPRENVVNDLSPPRWRDITADNCRRKSLAHGMSVVWQQNGEIWIGVRGECEIRGGLWHSPDNGASWQRDSSFFSVTSIDVRSAQNKEDEKIIVAEQSFRRLRGTEFIDVPSRVMERASDGTWTQSEAPPHGTNSEIEICGTLPNGTFYIRVDGQIYQQSSKLLYSWVIDKLGTFNR